MKTDLLNSYRFNLRYAHELVHDVEDDMMTISPAKGLENHPAFTLGHLASGAAMTSKYLGGPYNFSSEWEALFKRNGPGDPRTPEKNLSLYPTKTELLQDLSSQHLLVEKLIDELDENAFSKPVKWRYTVHMPTLLDLLTFMCITHESMHLSQLAAWRRAMDLPSALAKL